MFLALFAKEKILEHLWYGPFIPAVTVLVAVIICSTLCNTTVYIEAAWRIGRSGERFLCSILCNTAVYIKAA